MTDEPNDGEGDKTWDRSLEPFRDIDRAARLYRFLEQEWQRLGETRGSWCRKNGLSGSTVLRWGQGNLPDLPNLIRVAEATGKTLVEILAIAGYPVDGAAGAAPQPPDLAKMIRTDKTISREERAALLHIHQAFAAIPQS